MGDPTAKHVWRWPAWTGLTGLLVLLVAATVQKIWSADFWWQMKLGEWILSHHAIPIQEMFSYTAHGTPVREMRWLYCASIAFLWEHAGAGVLVLVQAGMVALAWGLVVWPVRKVLSSPLGLLVVGLGVLAGFNRWVMRPELITYVMTAAFLVMLERGTKSGKWRGLWFLPLLQVLWVNGHTTFLFGPVLAWAFAGADVVSRFAVRNTAAQGDGEGVVRWRLIVVAGLVTAACWVNPFGHWGAMYAVQMFRETSAEHATARTIMEMRSPFAIPFSMWGWDFWAAAGLCAVAVASLVPIWRRAPLSRVGVLVMSLYLLATLQRNTGLAAVMLGWVGTRNVVDLLALPWGVRLSVGRPAGFACAVVGVVFGWTGWYIATDRYAVRYELPREFGLGVVEWYQPRGAEAFILEHHPQKNLFNVMRDGSYFAWRVSDVMPIYIDGRTDAYGPAMLDELSQVSGKTWEEFATRRGVNTAVVPTAGYADVVQAMLGSPAWALVHIDPVSFVFVRRTPESEALIAACKDELHRALKPSADDPDDRVPAWKLVYGGVGRAWYTLGMGEALLESGATAAAEEYLKLAMERAPHLRRPRLLLAPLFRLAGRVAESEVLLEGATPAQRTDADRESARLLMNAGKLKEAIEPASRALSDNPDDLVFAVVVGDLYFQTGDFAKARDVYTRALDGGAGGVGEWNKLGAACEQVGDLPGALRAYRQSLTLDPGQHVVWNMAGGAAANSNDLKLAEQCFENAVKLKPDYGAAQRNLEKVRAMKGSK